ncbi:hypothetical protein D3C81_1347620 [compost metagenome]
MSSGAVTRRPSATAVHAMPRWPVAQRTTSAPACDCQRSMLTMSPGSMPRMSPTVIVVVPMRTASGAGRAASHGADRAGGAAGNAASRSGDSN